MVPVTQIPISIFGASLGVPSGSPPESTAGVWSAGALDGYPISAATTSSPGASAAPFADLLTGAVGQVGKLEQQARSAVEGLMSGSGVDVHEAMIATEKADMGFELMLSVRNKALSAYQQVMGMQF